MAVEEEVERVLRELEDVFPLLFPLENLPPQAVDRDALLVHHVVVLEEMFPHREVLPLDLFLGALDGAGDHPVLDGDAFLHAHPLHQAADAIASENAHQVVLEREVEAGASGVALAAGAASELVVDPPRLVTFGPEDVETALLDDLLVLVRNLALRFRERLLERIRGRLLLLGLLLDRDFREVLRIASEED